MSEVLEPAPPDVSPAKGQVYPESSVKTRRAWLLAGAAAYAAVDAAAAFAHAGAFIGVPWQPQAAIALAMVVLSGRAALPFVWVAVLVADWWLRGESGAAFVLEFAGTAAAYSAGGLALRRLTGWSEGVVGLRDLTLLVGIAALTALVAGGAQGLAQAVGTGVARHDLAMPLLLLITAEMLGLLCFAPLLLLAAAWRRDRLAMQPVRPLRAALESSAFVLLVSAILFFVFALQPFDELRMFYLMLLPAIAMSMRYGLPGSALALPVVQLGVVIALSLVVTRGTTAFEFQVLLLAIGLTALYVGVLSSERDRAAAQAATQELKLRENAAVLSDVQRTASTAELAGSLAHDLNQPLAAISNYARACRLLAESGPDGSARLLGTLKQIEQESARAGQYVRRMRDFFRTGTFHAETLSARALVDDACALLSDRLQREGIQLLVEVAPDAGSVRADSLQVGAVFGNLLGNACDALAAMRGPRVIDLKALRTTGAQGQPCVRFVVCDNGPGVPAEIRPQLFKPLGTTKPHGMGLGLALSRSIAERLGGRLWFEADAPLTTFCLELPAEA